LKGEAGRPEFGMSCEILKFYFVYILKQKHPENNLCFAPKATISLVLVLAWLLYVRTLRWLEGKHRGKMLAFALALNFTQAPIKGTATLAVLRYFSCELSLVDANHLSIWLALKIT